MAVYSDSHAAGAGRPHLLPNPGEPNQSAARSSPLRSSKGGAAGASDFFKVRFATKLVSRLLPRPLHLAGEVTQALKLVVLEVVLPL
ncbi:MAG: hypothetical protein WD627_04340, partial [Actinomycetota bacterium]